MFGKPILHGKPEKLFHFLSIDGKIKFGNVSYAMENVTFVQYFRHFFSSHDGLMCPEHKNLSLEEKTGE